MRGRWSDPSAFRADPDAAPAAHPSRRQTLALVAVLVLVAGAVVVTSYLIRPEKARAFDLFHGSVFLSDQNAPVAVDLANGKPTLQLIGADAQVGVKGDEKLGVVPLVDHTLLVNESTGEFNMVDNSGFVVKHDGGGVLLGTRESSFAVASDYGQAYIVQTDGARRSAIYLVNQSTVESAMSTRTVQPRAGYSMRVGVPSATGNAAGANGDLWLLVGGSGADGIRTIRQLSVPPNSSTGATLTPSDQGRVDGPAAIGTATSAPDGTGSSTVGVASLSRIDLFVAGSDRHFVNYQAPAGVDTILPTSNAQGRLAFLMHGTAGWYLVWTAANGTGLHPPKLIGDLPADAALAEPAASNGRLYTIDKATGALYDIGYDGAARSLAGRASYPLATLNGKVAESSDFADASVVGRGPRVIYNSPSHANALMVFTDGTNPPRIITKASAVKINATGGADALTRSVVPPGQKPGKTHPSGPPKPQPQQVQPVNTKINCRTAKQKPHIPQITSAVPGSRTVALAWSYPVIDAQDCFPSTYVVSVELLGGNAPPAPSSVVVQGQTGVTISGLFPSTRYKVIVTARINGQSTPSRPTYIMTGEEGPAAPTNLAVRADASGNWQVTWDSCGSVRQGCVVASSWTVTPSFCDGRGLSSRPPAITVTADPTSRRQPAGLYKGNSDLLGRGLQFQVQGTGEQGQAGAPSATSPCVYSWSPPNAAAMSLHASTAAVHQLGEPTIATVTLDLGTDPVLATGGVGATFVYQLLSGGNVVKTAGPTTRTTVRFAGIEAGVSYQARAIVAPPRHTSPTATVGPIDVETAHAPWPTITVSAGQPNNQGPFRATIAVHIGGLTSAAANGERFDLTGDSGVYCGNANATGGWDKPNAIDPADPLVFTVDRATQLFGSGCVIRVQLVQDEASGTAVFGAGTSSNVATSDPFSIDPPELLGVGGNDFTAQWDGIAGGQSQIAVRYAGGNPLIGLFAGHWSLAVTDPAGASCGGYTGASSLVDVSVDQACVDADAGSTGNWHVAVSFTYIGAAEGPYDTTLAGPPPTYHKPQCDVQSAQLSATWGGTAASPTVQIGVKPNASIQDCSGWAYTVVGPTTAGCGTGSGAPPTEIAVTCTDAPATTGWSVAVTYTDTTGTTQSANIASIDGPVPP